MRIEISQGTQFDDPAYDELLRRIAWTAPRDLAHWQTVETAEFLKSGVYTFSDRPLHQRILAVLRENIRADHEFALHRAFVILRGRVLRQLFIDRPDLLPDEAKGRVLLTEPRTATDRELEALATAFRDAHPEDHAQWRAALITLDKYHRVHDFKAPITVALEDEMARSGAPIVAFLMEHCWVQGSFPLLNARTVLRDLLIAGVPAGELAITDADAAALLVVVPSDEDVLAYLDCFLPVFVEERRFIITVRNHPELLSLLDLTEEIMASEKALNWQARGSAQSGDAGSHAQRFRIMKQLNEAVRAALEERERDGLLP